MMHALWATLRDVVVDEGRAALVTVLVVEGSAPREAGARMIVTAKGLRGTIGGGSLEHEAWKFAVALMAENTPRATIQKTTLGPDLGQCCGGRVTLGFEVFSNHDIGDLADLAARERSGVVLRASFGDAASARRTVLAHETDGEKLVSESPLSFIERFCDARRTIHLFGAGHVGKALVMALAPLPFRVIWYDEREESFPPRVPANTETRKLIPDETLYFTARDHVLIMTHSHALDLALVAAALRSRARFVGLIGSATKKSRFLARLRAAGFQPDDLRRITCPIGMAEIEGKEPSIIAASVAAQMLIEHMRAKMEHDIDIRPHHARVAMGAAE